MAKPVYPTSQPASRRPTFVGGAIACRARRVGSAGSHQLKPTSGEPQTRFMPCCHRTPNDQEAGIMGVWEKANPRIPQFPNPMGQRTGTELRFSANMRRDCRNPCILTRPPALQPGSAVIVRGARRGHTGRGGAAPLAIGVILRNTTRSSSCQISLHVVCWYPVRERTAPGQQQTLIGENSSE